MCCNNQFDFEKIPVVDRLDYDEISITGGESLLPGSSHLTTWLVGGIKATQYAMGLPESKFYLYTAFFDFDILRDCSYEFDGICLTPHKKVDVEEFMWKVKDMEWVKDCPVPEGEDFRRIKELF